LKEKRLSDRFKICRFLKRVFLGLVGRMVYESGEWIILNI
jgi:hypothetical protein